MNPLNDKFFLSWICYFLVTIFFFTLNPPLGIYLAIVMIPLVIHDVLAKFYNITNNKK